MKKIIKNMDKKLLIVTTLLFIFGAIMIFSASSVSAIIYGSSASVYFKRQLLFLGVGLIGFLILIRIPTSKYKKWIWFALLSVIGLLFITLVYSIAINNTKGWIGIGTFGVQPSEFAKVVMIIFLGYYYGECTETEIKNDKRTFISLIIVAVVTFMIINQNDFGTAAILFAICMFIFLISNVSKKIKLQIVISGTCLLLLVGTLIATGSLKILSSDKLARLDVSDPCGKYENEGNQVCNSYIAINGGGIFGKGLGNSTQKYLYLPEAHTDFIFAIVVEELGLVGGIILILCYIFILIRIVLIGKRAYKNSQVLICYGIAFYIFLHIIINLGGVTGIIPITGVPLPFISCGGSFAISIIAALTVVQRINYETNIKRQGLR